MVQRFYPDEQVVFRQHRLLNTLHTWALIFGSVGLLGVTAWTIAGVSGLVYAVAIGGLSMIAVRRISPSMVLRMYRTFPVTPQTSPEGFALVGRLARSAGLDRAPRLHVIRSRFLNAFAVGRRDDAIIVVTDALLNNMSLRELTGILAHEMTHISNEDIKVMTLADMVSRMTSALSTMGMLALLFNLSGFFGQLPWLGILAMIAAPTVGALLQLALSRTREFNADYGAVLLTRDPDGLSLALGKLERLQGRGWEHMFGSRRRSPSVMRTHPPTEDRIARLNALKGALGAGGPEPVAGPAIHVDPPRGSSPVPRVPRR